MPNLYGQTSFYSLLSQITLIWQIPSYSFSLTNPNKRGKGLIIYAHPLHITSSLPYNAFLPCKGRVTAFNTKERKLFQTKFYGSLPQITCNLGIPKNFIRNSLAFELYYSHTLSRQVKRLYNQRCTDDIKKRSDEHNET